MKTLLSLLTLLIFSAPTLCAQNVGAAGPEFALTGLDGGTYRLSELRGKVVYIFLFGAECSFCRQSAPATQRDIVNTHKNNPKFVAIGIDTWNRSATAVTTFRAQTGVSYPLLLQGGSVANAYSTTYDRNLVIDDAGVLRYKGTSAAGSDVNAVNASITNALAVAASNDDEIPVKPRFSLAQNFPNPFNPSTTIDFSIESSGFVTLTVYSLLGEKIAVLVSGSLPAGAHSVAWNGSGARGTAASGVYIYELRQSNGESLRRKMTLIK